MNDNRMHRSPAPSGHNLKTPPSRRFLMATLAVIGVTLLSLGVGFTVLGTPEHPETSGTGLPSPSDPAIALDVQSIQLPTGPAFVFTLGVMAPADERATLRFDDGRQFDFVVHQDGKEVWRWSDGRVFHQAVHTRSIDAGALHTFVHVWDGRDDQNNPVQGEAVVEAFLLTNPVQKTNRITVEIDG